MFHLIHFPTILYILCFTGSAAWYYNKGRGSSSSYNRSAIQQYQAQQQQPKVFQKPTLPQQPQVLQHPTLPQQQPQQPQQYTPEVQHTPQVTDTAQVMEPTEISCVSGDIQVSQEALFSTSRDRSLIYSSILAPVAPFSMETNPEDPNLSLSEITTQTCPGRECTISVDPSSELMMIMKYCQRMEITRFSDGFICQPLPLHPPSSALYQNNFSQWRSLITLQQLRVPQVPQTRT